MKNRLSLMFIALFISVNVVYSQPDFSEQAARIISRDIGKDLRNYKIYSYPTNNFGVGTSCYNRWIPRGAMLCDMIHCFGLENIPENSKLWRNVNNFTFPGTGGSIVSQDTLTSVYGVNLLLPKILQALNIKFNINSSKTNFLHLTIDSAAFRYLDYSKFKNFVLAKPQTDDLQRAFLQRRLLIVTSDFVLLKYSLTINPKDAFGLALTAKIDSALKIKGVNFSGQDSLSFNIKKSSSGSYTVQSSKPVIFGVFVQKQRSMQPLSTGENFANWETVKPADIGDPTAHK